MALAEVPGLILIIRPIGAYVKNFLTLNKDKARQFQRQKWFVQSGLRVQGSGESK